MKKLRVVLADKQDREILAMIIMWAALFGMLFVGFWEFSIHMAKGGG